MQTTLEQFNETASAEAFALQNSKLEGLPPAGHDPGQAHAGSGGMGRFIKKAVTGEGTQLMKVTGHGEVFLADQAQDVHLIKLEDDSVTCNGANVLAFDAGIDWDIQRVQGASSIMAGGLFNMALRGTGWVAILSDGPPVRLDVGQAPTFADAQPAITWSSGVTTDIKTDFKMKDLVGRGSGETIQVAFHGQGWVLVQPSEGRVAASPASGGGSPGGGLGSCSRARRRSRRTPMLQFVKSCGNLPLSNGVDQLLPCVPDRRDRLRQVDAPRDP